MRQSSEAERRGFPSSLLVATLLLVLVSTTSLAEAKVFTVNAVFDAVDANPGDGVCATIPIRPVGSVCTLRAAIQEANALPGADSIILPPGTYTLTIAGTFEDAGATGDLDITDDLAILGAGGVRIHRSLITTAITTIDGNALDRVFEIHSPATVTISRVTIRNGSSSRGGGIHNAGSLTLSHVAVIDNVATTASGGGIWNEGALGLSYVTISGNTAHGSGGGIHNDHGSLTLSYVTVSDNVAGTVGGGIWNEDTLGLSHVTVSGNTADDAGGGIQNSGALTLDKVVILQNTAHSGGGIRNLGTLTGPASEVVIHGNAAASGSGGGILNSGGVMLSEFTLSGNTAAVFGGGIYNSGPLTLSGFTIAANIAHGTADHAGGGGGIFNFSDNNGPVELVNGTISANTASGDGSAGGGIVNINAVTMPGGPVMLTNVTINGNGAQLGGGILGDNLVVLRNTIVANSTEGENCAGPISSLGHNLDSGSSCGLSDVGDLNNTDPLLGPLQDNGGFTATHALLAGSPAIDAGSNIGCPSTDQRGVARPRDGDGDHFPVCDIGAYELKHGRGPIAVER